MSETEHKAHKEVVGEGVTITNAGPNATIKIYQADRAALGKFRGVETLLEPSITLCHPVAKVWPTFKNFNLWMARYGYHWDALPADNEEKMVTLGSAGQPNLPRTRYMVRKVIPGKLIYFDSAPAPIPGKDGVWTGHNLVSLNEEHGETKIVFFMEHTWYSETMSITALRAEAKGSTDSGEAFWRNYFIPDLIAAVESRVGGLLKDHK